MALKNKIAVVQNIDLRNGRPHLREKGDICSHCDPSIALANYYRGIRENSENL